MPQPKRQVTKPRLDTVIKAIKAGRYDDDLGMLNGAIQDRLGQQQEAVRKLVKQTFGEDFDVVPARVNQQPPPTPFVSGGEIATDEKVVVTPEEIVEEPEGDFESRSPLIS